jgi:hypothetical protein
LNVFNKLKTMHARGNKSEELVSPNPTPMLMIEVSVGV